jgi:hypothetical protein
LQIAMLGSRQILLQRNYLLLEIDLSSRGSQLQLHVNAELGVPARHLVYKSCIDVGTE